jgi:hypothetical protein
MWRPTEAARHARDAEPALSGAVTVCAGIGQAGATLALQLDATMDGYSTDTSDVYFIVLVVTTMFIGVAAWGLLGP